jgi:hypothetical protein
MAWRSRKNAKIILAESNQFGGTPFADFLSPSRVGEQGAA